MRDVYIVAAGRSPIAAIKRGKNGENNTSSISSLSTPALAEQVLRAVIKQSGVSIEAMSSFRAGLLISQKLEKGMFHAPAKMIARSVGGFAQEASTLEGACATGLLAIEDLIEEIQLRRCHLGVAGGVEMMSNHPDSEIGQVFLDPGPGESQGKMMAELADRTTKRLGISRAELDQYAFESYSRARAHLSDHDLIPIFVSGRDEPPALVLDQEVLKREVTLETLGRLRPMNGCEILTPAHASKYGDAAAFVVLASHGMVVKLGLKPIARILGVAAHSEFEPGDFIVAPEGAVSKVLRFSGLTPSTIDMFEINEAFATSPVSFMRTYGIPRDRVNPWGGAIAHGHPIAATGAVLLVKLLTILKKEQKRFGVVSLCAAIGEAIAAVVEIL